MVMFSLAVMIEWRLRPWVRGLRLNELLIMEDVDWPSVSITLH
jgi:hypothetical protein